MTVNTDELVNKQRQSFISLSELGYGLLKLSFRRVSLHLTKWVGIIAIRTLKKRTPLTEDILAQTVIHSTLKAPARDEMPRPQKQNQATNIFNLELAGQLGEYWLKYRVQSLLRDFAKYSRTQTITLARKIATANLGG